MSKQENIMPYISWSRYNLFKTSKKQFHKKYILGEKDQSNMYFDKGKEFADYKEIGEIPHWVDDPMLEVVGEAVPRLDFIEAEIKVDLNGIDLFSKIDSMQDGGLEFYEYKTGKEPWTQLDVDLHEQLDFYACAIYLKFNIIPKCKLYWIETEEINIDGHPTLRYTGHVEEFERTFNSQDIVDMLTSIIVVNDEINNFELDKFKINEDLIQDYINLEKQKKEIEDKLSLIKSEVFTLLDDQGATYTDNISGNFTMVSKTNYEYSKELINLEKKYKDEIKLKKSKEVKSGKANKVEPTKYVQFKKSKK